LGEKTGKDLTSHLAAADVFVFPSLTDTFGVVSARGAGVRHAGRRIPGDGPAGRDCGHPVGALDTDLAEARASARSHSRELCRSFALERSWENSARQFIGNLSALQPSRSLRPAAA